MEKEAITSQVEETPGEVAQLKDLVNLLLSKDKEREKEIKKLKRKMTKLAFEHARDMETIKGLQSSLNRAHLQIQAKKDEIEGSDSAKAVSDDAHTKGKIQEERKEIKEKCFFKCKPKYLMGSDGLVFPVSVSNYLSQCTNPSPYMDMKTGQFKIPVRGRYRFGVWINISRITSYGAIDCVLHRSGCDENIFMHYGVTQSGYNEVFRYFDKDETIWLEIKYNEERGRTSHICFSCSFEGNLCD